MNGQPRVVDFKLPLPWLVGCGIAALSFMAALGWNASTASAKLDQLVAANTRLEKRLDERDSRLDTLRDSMSKLQNDTNMNTLRISNLERDKK